jgi:hypothetical protein
MLKTNSIVLQGSFPGGRPHSTVLLNNRSDFVSIAESAQTVQALMRHPNNLIIQQRQNQRFIDNSVQCLNSNNGDNVYQIDISKVNFNNHGKPLPKSVLQKMEKVFNTRFKDVKIHTERREAETIGAFAFTMGNDIYFASGRYNPYSLNGQKLLAHELTHVIQQKSARVFTPKGEGLFVINNPGLEAEAERMGIKVAGRFQNSPLIMPSNSKIMQCVLEDTEERENWLKENQKSEQKEEPKPKEKNERLSLKDMKKRALIMCEGEDINDRAIGGINTLIKLGEYGEVEKLLQDYNFEINEVVNAYAQKKTKRGIL